jgi:creatinine amidohydrolase
MRWEDLTGDDFAAAVDQCQGVCLVALSVIERHGHHLPTGTDMFTGRAMLDRAAALEPAIVFPDYYFTQIPEARHHPGTISIDGDLMVRLLDNVCREIARNGLKKVVLVSAHGGNRNFMPFFAELQLHTPKDYAVYLVNPIQSSASAEVKVPWPASAGGHAGPGETSHILAVRPELVHMDRIVAGEGEALNRLQHLKAAGVQTSVWWYADQPHHYQGDASYASAETGEALLNARARAVAKAVKAIKADTETLRLQNEFYARSRSPMG